MTLPISTVEQIIKLVDSLSSSQAPVAVLYYHLLVVSEHSQVKLKVTDLVLLPVKQRTIIENIRAVDNAQKVGRERAVEAVCALLQNDTGEINSLVRAYVLLDSLF